MTLRHSLDVVYFLNSPSMPVVPTDHSLCTVIVTVDAPQAVMTDLIDHARLGLDRFPDFEGFVGGALHISDDETRLVQYLQFASEPSYEAARDDPTWDEAPSTRLFAEHVAAGRALIDVRVYTVVAHTG